MEVWGGLVTGWIPLYTDPTPSVLTALRSTAKNPPLFGVTCMRVLAKSTGNVTDWVPVRQYEYKAKGGNNI